MICKLCCVYSDNVMRGRAPSYNYRILLSISLRGISWLEFSKIRLTTIKDFLVQWSPNFINIPLPKKKTPKKPKHADTKQKVDLKDLLNHVSSNRTYEVKSVISNYNLHLYFNELCPTNMCLLPECFILPEV